MNARVADDDAYALDALHADGCAIIEGEIAHRRSRPAVHAFRYPGFCLRLPLSRLLELCGGQWADACDVPDA